jgi:hypothetical protein
MTTAWESELAGFLSELSTVQEKTLEALVHKRDLLAQSDAQALAALGDEDEQLIAALQGCLDQRQRLLDQAKREGLPSANIQSLAKALPLGKKREIREQMRSAAHRARLLKHNSLVNWILVQKTLIHLSQLLQIIATGGRLQPTYQKDGPATTMGSLVDHAA